jgi:hypothetical protein
MDPVGVPGRIHHNVFASYWLNSLEPSKEIEEVIREGYIPPLASWPPRSVRRDNASARDPLFLPVLKRELKALEESKAITRVDYVPWCVLPLQLVHRADRDPRVVIDASHQINPYMIKRGVRLSTLHQFNEGVVAGEYWSSLDLKSGYYHLAIHPDYRDLFGIRLPDEGNKQVFAVWNVTFLGINDLVRTFTKLTKPILAHLHKQGVRILVYIDDFRITAATFELCAQHAALAREVLSAAGFVESVQKAQGPTPRGIFLGLVNDMAALAYEIPQDTLTSIITALTKLISMKRARIRAVASVYGRLAACAPAVGPLLRLLTREGQNSISAAATMFGWNGGMDGAGVRDEL